MNEKLKEFLDKQKAIERETFEEEKQKTLMRLGLYEKVYATEADDVRSAEWHIEYVDQNSSKCRYYKRVPIEVTDEEYAEIKRYCNITPVKTVSNTDNSIANALKVISWIIFIVGFIAGIIAGVESAGYYNDFSFVVAYIYWAISFISGKMFLGFAEIIQLLQDIKNK